MLNLKLPAANQKLNLQGISTGAWGFFLANTMQQHQGLTLAVVPDFQTAYTLEQELEYYLEDKYQILHFADWETLPYDNFSPHQDIVSSRLKALAKLPEVKQGILIVPIATLLAKLAPKSYIFANVFSLKTGSTIDITALQAKLASSSYYNVAQVKGPGEFAIRGSVIDIFPMGASEPFRLDLFDDEIESIRIFDVDSQLSTSKVDSIEILPGREFPMTEDAIKKFRQTWREKFAGDPRNCPCYSTVSEGKPYPGLEYYLPLFFDEVNTLLDYLPANTLCVQLPKLAETGQKYYQQIIQRYEQYSHDIERPILPIKEVFTPPDEILNQLHQLPNIKITADVTKNIATLKLDTLPDVALDLKNQDPVAKLKQFLDSKLKSLIVGESAGREQILADLLLKNHLTYQAITSWQQFLDAPNGVYLSHAPIIAGFSLDDKVAVVTEQELFGKKVVQKVRKSNKQANKAVGLKHLLELEENALVVHLDYGIGRYIGLVTLDIDGIANEFVTLQYADNDKIYLPVTSLNLLSPYAGVDLDTISLDKLGSEKWQKNKDKTLKQLRDVAAELLLVYAKRAKVKGHKHQSPDTSYESFVADFPFTETYDQLNAINDVIADMQSQKPMDRVVCGDVGFGKTEVAMRAAFLSVAGGKQVGMLVPTTLLAMQHFNTFQERFVAFGVNIRVISRLQSKKEQNEIIAQLKNGKCDVLIGTHKLLSEDIEFAKLGLLIIDEEHRFGVRQKERLKKLKTKIDILTLTATPIPRTLGMTMEGIRDLSLITTPPEKRLSVRTFVRPLSNALVTEAIHRELNRGGQVFYLFNNVERIEKRQEELQRLLPDAKIAIAHGQMSERQLENVMVQFYHHQFDILLCTTIIETGIDIPNANTILIERADMFGLAQLHQLRGRVGRSHHQAYAFFMITEKKLSPIAQKRLDSLERHYELGSGFNIAMEDLEIRGAGELLGDEQSGNMQLVGYQLYMQLLQQTISQLNNKQKDETELLTGAEIDLKMPAFFPASFLPDVTIRLGLYKRISDAGSNLEINNLRQEIIDRFGKLPIQVENLFAISKLKLLATPLGIKKIKAGSISGSFDFNKKSNINLEKLLQLMLKQPQTYQLDNKNNRLKFKLQQNNNDYRLNFCEQLMLQLAAS